MSEGQPVQLVDGTAVGAVEVRAQTAASASQLDLGRAPYALHGVKYIDPVSLACVSTIRPVPHTLT